jgi:microsomal epoxide hydrolase
MPGKPEGATEEPLTPRELEGLSRGAMFQQNGFAYATEHGTRPSTIGHVLSSSPVALLAWSVPPPISKMNHSLDPYPRIGEKFLAWTDEDPPLDVILESVSLYWFTETFPRSIYPYRQVSHHPPPSHRPLPSARMRQSPSPLTYNLIQFIPQPDLPPPESFRRHIKVPLGFSSFPKELISLPKSWIATSGNLVFYRDHDKVRHRLPA